MEFTASIFRDGGMFIYIILVVSMIGLAIIVERGFLLIVHYNVDGRKLWKKIHKFLSDDDFDGAKSLCANSKAPLMRILNKGLEASSGSQKDMQNAIDEVALEIIPAVDKRVHYLATLANIATLLGLLGTIQGLIQAFSAIAAADPSQKAALLSEGISIALYSTAAGLIVAIPMLAMHSVLQSKAHKIIDEVDELSVKLINMIVRNKDGVQAK